jgi:CRP-like cAMP-binding protein
MPQQPDADAAIRDYLRALCSSYGGGGQGTEEAIDQLLAVATPERLETGAVVAREGDAAEGAFLVVEGRLRASVRVDGEERVVNEAPAGEIIGEAGIFISGARRSATLTAAEPTTMLRFGRELFRLSAGNAAVIATEQHLLRTLSRRIANTDGIITRAWREASPGGRSALDGLSLLLGGGS